MHNLLHVLMGESVHKSAARQSCLGLPGESRVRQNRSELVPFKDRDVGTICEEVRKAIPLRPSVSCDRPVEIDKPCKEADYAPLVVRNKPFVDEVLYETIFLDRIRERIHQLLQTDLIDVLEDFADLVGHPPLLEPLYVVVEVCPALMRPLVPQLGVA